MPVGEDAALLEMRGISRSFPGVRALDAVDFTLRAGEVHALLGENGAGKSTLINILTGVLRPDGGTVTLAGQPLDLHGPAAAQRAGIAAVHQEVNLLPNLSVAENILIGRQPTRFGLVRRGEMNRHAARALARFGLELDVDRPLGACSIAVQQIVAIARAIDLDARVLVLDEPTASLDSKEVAILFDILRALKESGVGILLVTHFLDQVYEIADRITVLRNGKLVGERHTGEIGQRDLVTMMLGRELAEAGLDRREAERMEMVASFAAYGRSRTVEPFSVDLHGGETVGAAGLLGSGRTETALLMFGALPADTGEACVGGEAVRIRSPRDAIRLGFAFCPEDRKADGIVAGLGVRENILLALQARAGWLRRISRGRQEEIATRLIDLLGIRTSDADKPIEALSGGNQQKAVLARWLATDPKLMLLDEPTRGVDVGGHADILALVRRMCADGMAVYLISSEIDELVAVADRVSVMRERRQAGTLPVGAVSADAIMSAIAAS